MSKERKLQNFIRHEDGALTVLGLFLFLAIMTVGGLALDVGYAYKSRTELQVAADSAAHAALYTRDFEGIEVARAQAIKVAEHTLSPNVFGEVLRPEDIQFGYWDAADEVFKVDDNSTDAVMVNTTRYSERGNAVPSFLLKFVGMQSWDVQTGTVYETYLPACLREGFVAEDVVDIQSNNSFTNGFCIHSNAHVEMNSGNYFSDNTIVSMPDKASVVVPHSGYETNTGLRAALRNARYILRILNKLPDIIDGLHDGDPDHVPDYIDNLFPVRVTSKRVDATDFTPGRIHHLTCGESPLQIEANTVLRDVVIATNCSIRFGEGVVLENVVIATTSTSTRSITASSGLQIGRDDECQVGGGAQILTMGGVTIPANLKVYGGQIIAMLDIDFAANANGIEGASFIAGGRIDGTSNMTMGFCGTGAEQNFEAKYFHMRA